ncbi:MAG TPA: MucR family transcriptional regulator [Stellaceae bacterium]|nr:MucR family transcriptional regulator [Stellaceae bacterium]
MADDSSGRKVDTGLVAEIVSSYVGKNPVGIDQIGSLIATVHHTLSGLGTNAPAPMPEALTPAVAIRRSVQPDYVVCLECGFRGKILRRHLRVTHGLEPAAYRTRWKLSADHPITAPAYSQHRTTMAKQTGLGLGRRTPTVETPPAAKRRGRPRRPPVE